MALRQRFFLILIGLIIIPLIVECSLRLAGRIYYSQRAVKESKEQKEERAIKILCLGDSFTFGSGAKQGYSYPEQLERLLNKNNPDSKFRVYNYGGCVPGANSSYVLKVLDKTIADYQPQIIIVLIGMHNKWNLAHSNYFLFTARGGRIYLYRLEGLLTQLRIYKLLKIAIGNLRDRLYVRDQLQEERREEDESPEVEYHRLLAEKYLSRAGEVALAAKEYNKIIEIDPGNDEAYAELGRICENQKKYRLAAEKYKKALEINPNNLFVRERLWNVYFRQGKRRLAIKQIKEILKVDLENDGLRQILRIGLPSLEEFKDEELHDKLLRYDLEKIIKLAKGKGIMPVLLGYPNTQERDQIRREISDRFKVIFINFFSIFNKLGEFDDNYEDYFAKDGHCNAKGYRVMAEEIFRVLKLEMDL